jgi:hypothetical protein
MILQLKLRLLDVDPVIWRRVLVDDTSSLHELHRMIQILMGWWDYHLYQFEVDGLPYHGPGDEPEFIDEDFGEDPSLVTLRSLALRKGDVIDYEYDFGDAWRMEIVVERRRQTRGQSWILPWLLDGERAGPPEDCGGVGGFGRILDALEPASRSGRNGRAQEREEENGDGVDSPEWDDLIDYDEMEEERERRELLEWLGDYDPAHFDRRTANHFLVLAGAWGALRGREDG